MIDIFGDDMNNINNFENHFDRDFDESFKESLDNSYYIFLGEKTYVEIMATKGSEYKHFFFFDPLEPPTKEDVYDLIHMFEDYEDYEKCGELLNLIKYAY